MTNMFSGFRSALRYVYVTFVWMVNALIEDEVGHHQTKTSIGPCCTWFTKRLIYYILILLLDELSNKSTPELCEVIFRNVCTPSTPCGSNLGVR